MVSGGTTYLGIPYLVAKTLAAQGLAVFPVRDKQPLTDDGVYSATCDLDVLKRMTGWRSADGCGLATGAVNNLDTFDVDVRLWSPSEDKKELMGREAPPPADGEAVLAGTWGSRDAHRADAAQWGEGRRLTR
jgi:hypothetical protein